MELCTYYEYVGCFAVVAQALPVTETLYLFNRKLHDHVMMCNYQGDNKAPSFYTVALNRFIYVWD